MTPYPDRVQVVQLIQRAQAQGARLYKCCNTIGLCQRTYNRWLGENKEGSSTFRVD